MADIAALGFDVDTNNLALATKALNALAPAAANVNNAALNAAAGLGTMTNAALDAAKAEAAVANAAVLAAKASGTASKADITAAVSANRKAQASLAAAKAQVAVNVAAQSAATAAAQQASASLAAAAGLDKEASSARNAAAGLNQMQAAANGNIRSIGAMKANTANIAAQFQDVGVTAAMGMAPLQIALQQGTQLSAVFAGMKPAEAVGALGAAFGSIINPVSLATLAIVGLTAYAIQYFTSTEQGGAKSAEVLQKEAELIQKVAAQWGVAMPALKAYADEQQRLVDQQDQLNALTIAQGQSTESLLAGFNGASVELADMQDKLITLGQNQAANELRDSFDALQEKVRNGTATQEDFNSVITQSQAAFAAAGLNGNAFITMLTNLAGQASVTAKTMAGLNSEIDKLAGGGGSPNGRSVRGLKLGADGVVTLPSEAPAPDSAPNREDQGAWEDKVAARLAKANKQSGKTDTEKFGDIITGADNAIAKLQAEQAALGMTAQAASALKYETQLLNEANQKGIDLSPAERDQLHAKAEAMSVLETNIKNVKEAMEFAKDVTKGFFSDFAQGIEDGKGFWKSFGDAALNALNKIVDKLLNDVIDALFQVNSAAGGGSSGFLGSLMGIVGSLFGGGDPGIISALGLARGGVFENGAQKFASGGVVDRPTAFGMSGGRTGLMGEAGPETIMPIKRMGNGDMGIAATLPNMGRGNANNNQPQNVNINVNLSGVSGDKQIQAAVDKGVSDGLEKFSNHILPARVNEISSDPRRR